jgi:hypothetical protein
VVNKGPSILEQDPDKNLIFSWHNWDPSHWKNGAKDSIKNAVDQSIEKNICFIFGEFGPCEQCGNCSGTKIEWEYMIDYANQKDIGWLAWVWRWNDCHAIVTTDKDTYGSWTNAPWGEGVAKSNANSIEKTAQRTPYIENGACNTTACSESTGMTPGLHVTASQARAFEASAFDLRGRNVRAAQAFSGVRIMKYSGGRLIKQMRQTIEK